MSPPAIEVISHLRKIDEYEFEHFVSDLWERDGWTTTVTKGSNDHGIDVVIEKNDFFPQKGFIQVKRYAKGNKIGPSTIQQYSSLRHQKDGVDFVVIVTTSSFTSGARSTADSLNVKLVDSSDLIEMISNLDSDDLLRQYIHLEENEDRTKKGLSKKRRDEINRDIQKGLDATEVEDSHSALSHSLFPHTGSNVTVEQSKTQSGQFKSTRSRRSGSSSMYKTPSGYVSTKEEQDKEYKSATIVVMFVTCIFLYFIGLLYLFLYLAGMIVILLVITYVRAN